MAAPKSVKRYESVTAEKACGSTYTPPELADFVAQEMVGVAAIEPSGPPLFVLDPAVGEGQLLESLIQKLPPLRAVEVYGFDHDERALAVSRERLAGLHKRAVLHLERQDFLAYAKRFEGAHGKGLFDEPPPPAFDLIIANPPYVRTQIIGAKESRRLAAQFDLTGRVDLYHAFILAIASTLKPRGVAGLIVSNRFMTTKSGAGVRKAVSERFRIHHVWDLGDTKIFGAAVLPAVLVAQGGHSTVQTGPPKFSSVYETRDEDVSQSTSVIKALSHSGVVSVGDGRRFRVQHGTLDAAGGGDVWRIATSESDAWMATVGAHTWGTFRDIGKIRVGVKTCADRVFIRDDWQEMPESQLPELLRPLTTHHIGRRFRADTSRSQRQIVYPHECEGGRRKPVQIEQFPKTRAYLARHRETLEARTYVMEAGRKWYEIWVPQDPVAWAREKLVFRDISEEPCFWIDRDQSIVNGDCYWIVCDDTGKEDLLWLAASVGNSKFIEAFYDRRFNNKLYAGRRRFITQYVEKFPLPDPSTAVSKEIVGTAKALYAAIEGPESGEMAGRLDRLVWQAFGLRAEEVGR